MTSRTAQVFARLRAFSKPARGDDPCHLCGATLGPDHDHLVERDGARLRCACRACALLFDGDASRSYSRVHRRVVSEDRLSALEALERLAIPVRLATLVLSGGGARALYPSPVGVIESVLDEGRFKAWQEEAPLARSAWPDDAALLIDGLDARDRCHWISLDVCFLLIGRLRQRRSIDSRVISYEVDRTLQEARG